MCVCVCVCYFALFWSFFFNLSMFWRVLYEFRQIIHFKSISFWSMRHLLENIQSRINNLKKKKLKCLFKGSA